MVIVNKIGLNVCRIGLNEHQLDWIKCIYSRIALNEILTIELNGSFQQDWIK